jgi:hypothetical protein
MYNKALSISELAIQYPDQKMKFIPPWNYCTCHQCRTHGIADRYKIICLEYLVQILLLE